MKKTIEKYKKLIFIWGGINCFALLVNTAGINFEFSNRHTLVNIFYNSWKSLPEGVWPFVKFVEDHDGNSNIITTGNLGTYGYTEFNGIFYQYDISEFLLYMGILVAFLVYKAYITTPIQIKVPNDPS